MKKMLSITSLVLVIVLSVVLSGCAGNNNTNGESNAPKESNEPTATNEPKETDKPKDSVKITFSNWTSGLNSEVLDEVVKEFQVKFPHITVEQIKTPFGEYSDKMQAMMAGKQAPDVMYMSQLWFQSFADKGAFMDISSRVTTDSELNYADFNPTLQSTGDYKGSTYMIYDAMDILSFFYNKNMFTEAGIDFPDETWTWADVVEAGKKLTKDTNNDGVMDQYGILAPDGYVSFSWIYQNGGSVLNDDRTLSTMTEPAATDAIQWISDLINTHKIAPAPSVTKQEGSSAMFRAGKIGMAAYGPWLVGLLKTDAKFDFGLTLLPSGKENRNSFVSGSGYVISKDTKNEEAAWELMKYLVSPDVIVKFMEHGLVFPTRQSLMKSEYFFTEENVTFSDQSAFVEPLPLTPNWNAMFDAITKEYQLIWMGDKSVADATKAMDEQVNEVLK